MGCKKERKRGKRDGDRREGEMEERGREGKGKGGDVLWAQTPKLKI